MKYKFIVVVMLISMIVSAQRKTDGSLFMKKHPEIQLTSVGTENGDLYKQLGHHGPAIENLWVGYRFYFARIVETPTGRIGNRTSSMRWFEIHHLDERRLDSQFYSTLDHVVAKFRRSKFIETNPGLSLWKSGTTNSEKRFKRRGGAFHPHY